MAWIMLVRMRIMINIVSIFKGLNKKTRKMKKVVLALIMVSVSGILFAQNAKVTTASNHLKYNQLRKAKVAIDEASVHPKTQGKAKTLVYKGKIYYSIATDTSGQFNDISKDAIFVSAESFEEAKKNADSRTDMAELNKYLNLFVYNNIYDRAVGYYNNKEYVNASKYFGKCAEIRAADEILDTVAYYYAANSAAAGENHDVSISYYDKIKDSGYEEGGVYGKIASQYKAKGDTAKAIEIIGEGRTKYPENQSLLISEFNIYVEKGETEKAIGNIDKAIEANPQKAAYYYVRGKLKESLGDVKGAEEDYKSTLAIDADHLDANHDLGALYVNESIVVVEEMNALPMSETTKYEAKKKELDDIYSKSLPYLKKAYELDPSDIEVQGILKKLYLRSKDMDSYKKLQEEIDAVDGQ
jgi:tetratricopeptide (TPR) repeat protein